MGKLRQQLSNTGVFPRELREKTLLEVGKESTTSGRDAFTLLFPRLLPETISAGWKKPTSSGTIALPVQYWTSCSCLCIVSLHLHEPFSQNLMYKDEMLGEFVCEDCRAGPTLGQGHVLLKLSYPLTCIEFLALIEFYLFFFQQHLRNITKKTSALLLIRKRRWLTTTKGELYGVIRF